MYYLKGKTASWLLLGLGVPPALASLPSFEPVAVLSSSSTSKVVKDGTAISLSRASKLLSVCSMFLKWHQTWTNKQTKLYQGRPYMLQISYFSFPFFFKSKISTNLDASSNSAPTVHRDSRSYSSLRSWNQISFCTGFAEGGRLGTSENCCVSYSQSLWYWAEWKWNGSVFVVPANMEPASHL